ncbi:deoxyribonuclease IV [Aquibacillus salsiterrae]|uniref:Deoxyribonuclease IV n=1 Tax=Aquibacillus salsiterrae TaxID=2950439 RepID=A0A9X4AE12_9BACI|nr:deoxyribonuclease IV [Aquibacillus salsiterrae]MDC3416227.1 deoxyribonuclease IV [Aquibacillus salsiterrae]
MRFGSHVSIKEGYSGAALRAIEMGALAFQYFPKNPRALSVKEFNKQDTLACRKISEENNLVSISHSPYPTNLTATKEKRQQVIDSLLNDLDISNACGSIGVVVHFGKQMESLNRVESYKVMIDALNQVLSVWDGSCKILLENTAGTPGSMGTTMEELVQIRKLTDNPEKIGFCLDTCHAFSSGLWNGDNLDEFIAKGEELSFFNHLEAIHLNNSKYATESGKDRHANLFVNGYIKEKQLKSFILQPTFRDVPFILETPDDEGIKHEEEIAHLYEKFG